MWFEITFVMVLSVNAVLVFRCIIIHGIRLYHCSVSAGFILNLVYVQLCVDTQITS